MAPRAAPAPGLAESLACVASLALAIACVTCVSSCLHCNLPNRLGVLYFSQTRQRRRSRCDLGRRAAASSGSRSRWRAGAASKRAVVGWSGVGAPGVVVEVVDVLEDAVNIDNVLRIGCSGHALAFPGWLEVVVPAFERFVELHPPLCARWLLQEPELLVVEELVRYVATILESCNVNQPLEVGNDFRADEILICAVDLLLENVRERAVIIRKREVSEFESTQGSAPASRCLLWFCNIGKN